MSSTFVVGYDGSPCAEAALTVAVNLAKELDGKLVVAFGFYANPMGGEVTDYRKALEEHGQRLLSAVVGRAAEEGVTVEPVLAEEEPAEALVDLAAQHDARAIIVGTRGEGPLKGALVGSVPHKLLQLSDRPVLVVPE
jgi:nucleotide-binding universal stress UspA family protein